MPVHHNIPFQPWWQNPEDVIPQNLQTDPFNIGGGIGESPYGPQPILSPWEETPQDFSPFTQYLAQSGLLGAPFTQPGTRFARGLYNPLRSLFDIQEELGEDVGMPAGEWQGMQGAPSYLSGFRGPGGGYKGLQGGIYGRAAELLSGLYGMGVEQRGEGGFGFSPTYGLLGEPLEGTYLSPARQRSLLTLGLAGQWGLGTASRFAGRLPRMRELYQEKRAAGQAGGFNNFLDWLSDRYDLGRYFGTDTTDPPTVPGTTDLPAVTGVPPNIISTAGGALPVATAGPPLLPTPTPTPTPTLPLSTGTGVLPMSTPMPTPMPIPMPTPMPLGAGARGYGTYDLPDYGAPYSAAYGAPSTAAGALPMAGSMPPGAGTIPYGTYDLPDLPYYGAPSTAAGALPMAGSFAPLNRQWGFDALNNYRNGMVV
jgi:hypothetical protein